MSCTVLALPYALAWVVATVITDNTYVADIIADCGRLHSICDDVNVNNYTSTYDTDRIIEEYGRLNNDCEDVHVIDEQHFIEKTFETPFVDKDLLMKTLEEHGVTDIHENEFGRITGKVDSYSLNFEKQEADKPYTLNISCLETDNAEEKIGDLSSEYALNVQENAYLNIVEKLKANNMEIEDEEVMDDNTIVLTVNLE